jgi:glyoxylase-like metal-dependent hydrolase (beta-lactamase superfamily II)
MKTVGRIKAHGFFMKTNKEAKKMQHEPVGVTPHLFQLGTKSFPVYLSMGKEGMIIEGGTGPTYDIIVSQIDSLGIDPMKIRYIVLTHTHADHVGALPRFRKAFPHMKVLACAIAEKILQKERFLKEFLPTDKMISDLLKDKGDIQEMPLPLDKYDFEVDTVVSEGENIDLGDGIVWTVYNAPGHSPCHITLFEDKEKTLAIGDITGYYDPERDIFWPNYFYSLESYCDTIRKMLNIPASRLLLSHNGVIEGDSGRHLVKALKATEAYHQEMLDRTDKGESNEHICNDKADWIESIGALASRNILLLLCDLMIKNSQKDREKQLFTLTEGT